ncbi:LLM class flavin-dependent oxidoreductase [Microbacterium gorillae]|uniref:LLM class flavin-dependent oxidoreductase n=1 Tax=Microbacterium gorillae TaxID=1231063 RepID=UPI00058C637B|nr:LLM class flavin-dependent oxidoreductase [Microbacterium gorillae]
MDYGHDLIFGSFITPIAQPAQNPVALARISEEAGLDLVTFQDHPYQPAFLDTWTLMSYVAAQTERIHISANVINVPLRMPTLPRAAASLDILSGGRFDLALGSGGFWDAITAMGGPARTKGEAFQALEETIDLLRATWDTSERGGIFTDNEIYPVRGAKRGPRPAHEIPVWLGALGPRGLRLIGRKADGWLPSEGYLKPGQLAEGMASIDAAAGKAGRDPREIRRLLNIQPEADPTAWAHRLAALTLEHGVSAFIVATDDPGMIQMFAQEVAPAVRELVATGRTEAGTESGGTRSASALASRIDGIAYDDVPAGLEAIEPGDFAYADVRDTYTRGGRPGIVLMPTDTAQVAEAVRFAGLHPDVPLSIRSGGHGISGASTNHDGIVINLRRLNAIEVLDEDRRLVRIGPGARWGEVAAALAEHGWALGSGDMGAVGVGGLATAGGVGYFSRESGLTIDHLVAAEIVLADGSVRRVDAEHEPDLFWAVRGAGGNVGIVTSFDFVVDEVGPVGYARLYFDLTDLENALVTWGQAVEASPRDTTGFLTVAPQRDGRIIGIGIVVIDQSDPDIVLSRLQSFAQVGPLLDQSVTITSYAQVVAAGVDGAQHAYGAPATRSGLFDHLTPEFARAAADLVRSGATYFFQIRAVGGAVADVADDATAYAHREANFAVVAFGAARESLDHRWAPLATMSRGLYTSFEASDRPERIGEAFPPETLDRLRRIKAQVDPGTLFRDNFAVGAAE